MEIKLLVGEALKLPEKKNVYEMEVKSMSGDADAYETKIFTEGNSYGDFYKQLQLTIAAFAISNKTYIDSDRQFQKAMDEVTEALGIDWDSSDFLYETFGRDVTYEDGYAKPDRLRVYWYNEHGVKHAVKIQVGDEQFNYLGGSYEKIPEFWLGINKQAFTTAVVGILMERD